MAFMKAKNIPIVNDEAYPVNTLDFRPIMTKVKANNPDMVLLIAVATTDAILMHAAHAKEIGINARAPSSASAAVLALKTSPSSLALWPRKRVFVGRLGRAIRTTQ